MIQFNVFKIVDFIITDKQITKLRASDEKLSLSAKTDDQWTTRHMTLFVTRSEEIVPIQLVQFKMYFAVSCSFCCCNYYLVNRRKLKL